MTRWCIHRVVVCPTSHGAFVTDECCCRVKEVEEKKGSRRCFEADATYIAICPRYADPQRGLSDCGVGMSVLNGYSNHGGSSHLFVVVVVLAKCRKYLYLP